MVINPDLDLVLERDVAVERSKIWAGWTQPELLKQWFTPVPFRTVEAEIDLRPGGIFRTLFLSPEGDTFPNLGCYLDVVPETRLVWTNALLPAFRPNGAAPVSGSDFRFTAIISLADSATGTLFNATVMHETVASRELHEQMGFHDGWGIALDQLVALITSP